MRRARQVELLQRVASARPTMKGLHGPSSAVHPASEYTDRQRFDDEMRVLFREGASFFAMSCELSEPGSYRAGMIGGVPILVVRQPDGSLRAMVNACRHRGASLKEDNGTGVDLNAIQCNYHLWTYDLDGTLRSRPGSAGAFDDVDLNCDLHQRPVAERYGMIFVRAAGDEPIDVDATLSGAEDDLGAFGLGDFVHIETRTITRDMNWKLLLDTFTESYHIRGLHRETLAPVFDSNCIIHDEFGPNVLAVGFRSDITDELTKPVDEWSLLPYGTIQYFLVPNALLVYQIDHVELWRLQPEAVDRTSATVSVFAPEHPRSERSWNYFVKNLDLLLQVTGGEDFPVMERIQRNLESGALPEVVYGRNEAPLIHLHRSINEAMAAGGCGPDS
ncbi:MAG: aromatic ring-hydroxylating dioxygenase subunit alpha [Acidimicrobiia bacterium]|nr:aromatic ring-hydroxylating dioxygenase subunit alpha [Acidimicrobiia bacterium]MDH5520735.1 aromatic ring-hydroxylating dioxygenase subunit alpha [Acidimicrobiia bacterium]